MTVEIGDDAPYFKSLDTYKGDKNIILYFYPKDDTPGCTKEAKDFQNAMDDFVDLNTVIIGVSKDNEKSHDNFKRKHNILFELISDEGSELSKQYGTWVEKNMFGKAYMGIGRSTFLIDKNGKIRKIWRNVKVSGHVDNILEIIREIM
ncbi:peroxiredoxin [Ehrlichia canis]|uniref:Alkyl hydroperoxide reductase/ Thiolspecificantioxidant/ Mal allergen n=1 Tax=Ehrlichia canis (strain Jake) TaxID=269484 RepID=A0ACA6AWB8_EHRCJ|nr:peroxiredoxin [Ehrlichia canis]AAZ68531.1 Alkyl hydroperoxide reductase/ Thiolspecificantioxidant/ Mal allergen [Ehrlichia canis str. Jake]AUO54728.1 peroxiredoxin [Ehrlichia canis]UKC53713.1 peroxiredoxin [Ehrlichia canis]UKC54651.1 peroxiredoxin [Ehrlichia canis]UKC55587.1 peroxiredoxin [Ehrlichia canis]